MRTSLLILVLALALLGLLAPKTSTNHSLIVIGGEYTVQSSETRRGDVVLILARVNIVEGGSVEGNIHLFGSVLNIAGQVRGQVQAYGGKVSVDNSAQVDGAITTDGPLPGLPLFPSILLVVS